MSSQPHAFFCDVLGVSAMEAETKESGRNSIAINMLMEI